MKKHTYRAQKVNNINWQQVKEQTTGETPVLAVGIAKVHTRIHLVTAFPD